MLRSLASLEDDDFRDILLQRRFLSLAFTPAYDLAIDLLTDEEGLEIARVILREEYPRPEGRTRSHREDMKEDLLRLGITRQRLAPQELVVPTERGAVCVGVFSAGVGPKVKRGVDHHALFACDLTSWRFAGLRSSLDARPADSQRLPLESLTLRAKHDRPRSRSCRSSSSCSF